MTVFSSPNRTTSFRYVRVGWPSMDELGELAGVEGCSIEENQEATIKASGSLRVGGGWVPSTLDDMVRVYSTSTAPGEEPVTVCHGTFLVSVPSTSYGPAGAATEADLYGVLKILQDAKLTDALPMAAGTPTVEFAASLARRAGLHVVAGPSAHKVASAHGWDVGTDLLTVVNDCMGWAGFSSASTDGYGNVILSPYRVPEEREVAAVLSDGERGGPICGVAVSREHDPASVPNVSVVVYSPEEGEPQVAVVRNDDPSSEFSTVRRSREVVHVEEVTELSGKASDKALSNLRSAMRVVDRYTVDMLWWPLSIGEAVRLDYRALGGTVDAVLVKRSVSMTPALRCECVARRFVGYFEATEVSR